MKSTQCVLFKIISLLISPDRRLKAYLFRPGMLQRRDVVPKSGREKLIYLGKHHGALAGVSDLSGKVGFGRNRGNADPAARERAGPNASRSGRRDLGNAPAPRNPKLRVPENPELRGTGEPGAPRTGEPRAPRYRRAPSSAPVSSLRGRAAPSCGWGSQRHRSHRDGQSILKIYLQSCVQHEGITFRIHIFIHI